jgi:hypothetical protein
MGSFISPTVSPVKYIQPPVRLLEKSVLLHQDFECVADGAYRRLSDGGGWVVNDGVLRVFTPNAPASDTQTFVLDEVAWVGLPLRWRAKIQCNPIPLSPGHNAMFGLIDGPWANDISFRFDYPRENNVCFETRKDGSATYVDGGVALTAGFHIFEFRWYPDRVEFYYDGSYLGAITTNVPIKKIRPYYNAWVGAGNSTTTLECDWVIIEPI